jgi:hypothetical protein
MQVYVIERPDGQVKIGKSGNPTKRIRALESQGGFRSNRAWVSIPGALANTTELRVHHALNHRRKVGEWFAVDFEQAVSTVLANGQIAGKELTADEVIDRLGGTFKTAELFNLAPPSVSEWRAKNSIPKARLMYLQLARPDVFQRDPIHDLQSIAYILSPLSLNQRQQALKMLAEFVKSFQ